jgi:hypothetical protein
MPAPLPNRLDGFAGDSTEAFASKIKIRFVVEKLIDEEWVTMARLSEEADRIQELCEAIGGKIRVLDLVKQVHVVDEEFE